MVVTSYSFGLVLVFSVICHVHDPNEILGVRYTHVSIQNG